MLNCDRLLRCDIRKCDELEQGYSQGYIHCMPNGNVSFVTKLSPLQPGYEITVCPFTNDKHIASTDSIE